MFTYQLGERYGLYLDDGWMYVYRSKLLIGRFRLKHDGENWMMTTDTQLSGERSWDDSYLALSCVLKVVNYVK